MVVVVLAMKGLRVSCAFSDNDLAGEIEDALTVVVYEDDSAADACLSMKMIPLSSVAARSTLSLSL